MKLFVVLTVALACAPAQDAGSVSTVAIDSPADGNVNSRYIVESVELLRITEKRVSRPLREELDSLIGRRFDPGIVTELAGRLAKEVRGAITHRVERGLQPEHVRLIFEGRQRRWDEDDAKVTKLAYHQKQGWTLGLEGGFDFGDNRIELGVQSDADRLLERYAGFNAGYSRRIGERVRLRFEFETFHQQWAPATEAALVGRPDVPGIYRERYNMEPAVAVLLAPDVTLTAGVSFQHFQTQFPAARFEASNAVFTTLRHVRRWDGSSSSAGQEVDAGYTLRAATRTLDSDFVYTRHSADARYAARYGPHFVTVRAEGGFISGTAPLYERFALGDSRTLRGWNKFDIDPLGGSRAVYGSVQYRYRWIGTFYDAGSVWDRNENVKGRHAVGVILAFGALREGPFIAIGFPLRNGSLTPMFTMGMDF
jgi:hypothetical protein